MTESHTEKLKITSETGRLRRVLVHSPDSGLGKVVPSKAQDWLFEDIVHLDTIRREEYDYFTKLLLYFLDPDLIRGSLQQIDDPAANRNFYKPGHADFFRSEKVVELQWLLEDILRQEDLRLRLVASVCAIENCSYETEKKLLGLEAQELAKTFITGSPDDRHMLFPPIPNFIFTRDIGVVINDFLLLNKPAKKARIREALLAKYIFFNHPFFSNYQHSILELPETDYHFLLPKKRRRRVTLEGGDVMVVSRDHLLIGVSERTTLEAAHQAIKMLFEKDVVKKISIIDIPKRRDYMHIDTVFTQVKKNVWVLLGAFSKKTVKRENADAIQRELEGKRKKEKLKITQFRKKDIDNPRHFDNLEDLLADISERDLESKEKTRFIYSGNNEFPFDAREQWTDSCNLLALKDGVVLGYDRNDKTIEAFRKNGFDVIHVHELIEQLENGTATIDQLENLLILMPSSELSRARGGFHCMTLPLLRDELA